MQFGVMLDQILNLADREDPTTPIGKKVDDIIIRNFPSLFEPQKTGYGDNKVARIEIVEESLK